eukprot:PhM_4_TR18690/c0_g3_i1/m.98821
MCLCFPCSLLGSRQCRTPSRRARSVTWPTGRIGAHATPATSPAPYNTADRFIPIFDSTNAPDMISAESENANEFKVTVSPALCHTFQHSLGSSGLTVATNTVTEFRLTGTASVATYHSVVTTINLQTCLGFSAGSMRVYDILWYFSPNMWTYVRAADNNEPHYYKVFSNDVWANGVSTCDNSNVFGQRGYLTVMDDLDENNWLYALQTNFWMGISDDGNEGTWTIRTGPRAQQSAYVHWNGAPDNDQGNQHWAYNYNSMWDDSNAADNSRRVVCEYGGFKQEHATGKNFRGAARVKVLLTACDFGVRANWAHPGTCSQQTLTMRYGRSGDVATKKVFSDAIMPDVAALAPNGLHATGFEMKISPALCAAPSVVLSNGIAAPTLTTSDVLLNGAITYIGSYWTVAKTITVSGCYSEVPRDDVYEILWQLHSSYWTFNGAYGEPHYYSVHTSVKTFADALAACSTYNMWGLQGYLVTLTSAAETSNVVSLYGATSFWAGGEGWRPRMWFWSDGPEAGQSIFATAWSGEWNLGEPDKNVYSVVEGNYGGSKHNGIPSVGVVYICEYGGTEGPYAFRGGIHFTVSQVSCEVPSPQNYFEFPGVCHVAFDAQLPGATKTR